MPAVELIMPKMGESIMEATILKWLKKPGDRVEEDEPVLEIATDKVDSEVPSPVSGVISEILYNEGDTVPVGKPIAIIQTEEEISEDKGVKIADNPVESAGATVASPATQSTAMAEEPVAAPAAQMEKPSPKSGSRFYSPLVLNIARQEGISMAELEQIPGTGLNQRVTKKDILNYIKERKKTPTVEPKREEAIENGKQTVTAAPVTPPAEPVVSGNVEIVEMDRMRKLIADHMVMSKRTSPHVTSFVEVDVTKMVVWRNKNKARFEERYGQKITFTPLFVDAIVKALRDFPRINASVDGTKIIIKKDLNIGIATALPDGNLIVPVLKAADQYSLAGLALKINDLVSRARENKLKPEEIQDGTFTLTNVGTFGNLMGTPIINQPQVAILATGAIKKKPVVIETELGDTIGIRHMMFLSLSYDHRIVDGYLGGSFLRRVADYMEAWDLNHPV